MFSSGRKNVIKWRLLSLKQELILCIAIFVNLSKAQNHDPKIDIIKNEMPLPYGLKFVNESLKINDAVPVASNCKVNFCQHPECIHTASRVLNYMDQNVEPCDNFYKFACGQFLKNTQVPVDKPLINNMKMTDDKIEMQMINFLQLESKPTEPKHVQLVKTYYHNCMNETAVNQISITSALDLLKKIGGWPLLEGDSWKDDGFHWEALASKVRSVTGIESGFFTVNNALDPKNRSKRILRIAPPPIHLSFTNYYYNFIVDIAYIFGAELKNVENELKQIFQIGKNLSNITSSSEKNDNSTMTIEELEETYPNILWREQFNMLLNPETKIEDGDVVQLSDRSFFDKLNTLINNIPKRDQANFIMWIVVDAMTDFLNFNVQMVKDKLLIAESGMFGVKPRWKKCYHLVNVQLRHCMAASYINNFLNEENKKNADEIVDNVFQQFKINIQNMDWLDNKTMENALEKLQAIKIFVGYPGNFFEHEEIDKFYTSLEVNPGDFFQSFINITKFPKPYFFRKPFNKMSWTVQPTPLTAGAMYIPDTNTIHVLASIIQGIFINNDIPQYMNYGSLGYVVGHEITHGFDNNGGNYDKDGYFVNWWQPETKEEFLSKVQCFIHQYGNYTVEEVGLKLNGTQTLGENIADSGGFKAAYLAYEKWAKEHGPELLLPGLNYTQQQLYWINGAQTWCTKLSLDGLKHYIDNDEHSLPEFRILGSFSNQPEFARDFKCAQGTRMNPVKKCSIW